MVSVPGESCDPGRGTVLTDIRSGTSRADPGRVFATLLTIGGSKGWYSSQRLWQVRGVLDRLVGGPGLRRGRRDPKKLMVGDPVDCWRVEQVVAEQQLGLRAEMRLPGNARLTWTLSPLEGGMTRITQTAEFQPRGLLGHLYWLSMAPFHRFVFPWLLADIIGDAEISGNQPRS